MRVNLTQHASLPEQACTDLPNLGPILTFNELPTRADIFQRCETLADLAQAAGAAEAMIGGALWLMEPLAVALRAKGIKPVFAFSQRVSVEKDGVKTSIFKHLGFVEAEGWGA